MNKRLSKDKKGQEMIIDFWVIIGFVAIVIIFMVFFFLNVNKVTNDTQDVVNGKDVNFMLNSFLEAPALGVSPDKRVSDIIIEDYTTDDYANTDILFKSFFKSNKMYNYATINSLTLCIKYGDSTKHGITKNSAGDFSSTYLCGDEYSYTNAYLPNPYGKEIIVMLKINTK